VCNIIHVIAHTYGREPGNEMTLVVGWSVVQMGLDEASRAANGSRDIRQARARVACQSETGSVFCLLACSCAERVTDDMT